MQEMWKDIKGYDGLYQISNLGRVKRLEKIVKQKDHFIVIKEKMMKPTINHDYLTIMLKNINRKSFLVHRLVAMAFIPNKNNYKEVNHIDGNKKNNRIDNLEWCSHLQNMQHAVIHNLIKTEKQQKAIIISANKRKKKIIQMKGNIVLKEFNSIKDASVELNISMSNISAVLVGRYKQTHGYNFIYKINQRCNNL